MSDHLTSTPTPVHGTALGSVPAALTLTVNGQIHRLDIESRVSLLDALREVLNLTGTKKGCNQGTCGASCRA